MGTDLGEDLFDRCLGIRLDASLPIVCGNLREAFYHIACHIRSSEIVDNGFTSLGFRFQNPIGNRSLGGTWSRLEKVVDDIEEAAMITTIDGAMSIVSDNIIRN